VGSHTQEDVCEYCVTGFASQSGPNMKDPLHATLSCPSLVKAHADSPGKRSHRGAIMGALVALQVA